MAYTLGDAARATGKSKPTIAKAIKTGRLSAARADDGSYQIDPAELHRVYPLTGENTGNRLREDTPVANGGLLDDVEVWRALATEREETIRDLRHRLDESEMERRQVQERLTGLLTHRQVGSVPLVQRTETIISDRRSWWRRWFR